MSFITKLCSNTRLSLGSEHLWTPLVTSLRYRYHKDKLERGPLHRLGYKDNLLTEGLLPRSKDFKKLRTKKQYCPPNPWREEVALYGRNDYIDILGDSDLRPFDVSYNVPAWLRGFEGNEFQMLLRRKKTRGHFIKEYEPAGYSDMLRRINYLYKDLNVKRRDYFWKADRARS